MKKLLIGLLFAITFNKTLAQFPDEGRLMPQYPMKEITFPDGKQVFNVSMDHFKGKFIIVEFWNRYCTSCIYALPKMEKLQNDYKGSLTFLLVGEEDEEGKIRNMYERLESKLQLHFVTSFDSTFFKKVVPERLVPHAIWIDEMGTVQAITSPNEISKENIDRFLHHKPFEYISRSYSSLATTPEFNSLKPIYVDGNYGQQPDFIFRSMLLEYTPRMPSNIFPDIQEVSLRFHGLLQGGKMSLRKLYMYSITGRVELYYQDSLYHIMYNRPILEVGDTSLFVPNYESYKNIFFYSLKVPDHMASPSFILKALRKDLDLYFGYTVEVQNRLVPCWELTATDAARRKLKARKSAASYKGDDHTFFDVKNMPWNKVFTWIFFKQIAIQPAIFDETGITGNVDMRLDFLAEDMSTIKEALKKQGVILTRKKRLMKVVVIKEKGEG